MELFHVIEDGVAILRLKRGIFRQTKIYRRGEQVFAAVGGGYVRLIAYGGTTNTDITCLEVAGPGVTLDARRLPTWSAEEGACA
jgi:hypothetical protein